MDQHFRNKKESLKGHFKLRPEMTLCEITELAWGRSQAGAEVDAVLKDLVNENFIAIAGKCPTRYRRVG
jgi:hypothetical protein